LRRKIITLIVAVVAMVCGGLMAVSEPAQAYRQPKCMDKWTWKHIHEAVVLYTTSDYDDVYSLGDTRAVVKNMTGGYNGKVIDYSIDSDGSTDQTVSYRQCLRNGQPASKYSTVDLYYGNWDPNVGIDLYPDGQFRVFMKGSWSKPSKNY
jgi:hypothetical protein